MRETERKGKETAMVKLAANNLEIYNLDAQAKLKLKFYWFL